VNVIRKALCADHVVTVSGPVHSPGWLVVGEGMRPFRGAEQITSQFLPTMAFNSGYLDPYVFLLVGLAYWCVSRGWWIAAGLAWFAIVAGSWKFILSFAFFMLFWIGMNMYMGGGAFDPFPFILLNLILSCLAAVQAPIILMSQNRQAAKDRIRSDVEYEVNLKAELEVAHLHEKIDHMNSRLLERLDSLERHLGPRP
jgi:hypothetical protein